MNDFRLPKRILFGWLPQRRPAHGTKQRWRDKVRKDLKQFGIDESSWFRKAQDRLYWRAVCKDDLTACTEERQRKRSAHGCGYHAAADAATPAAPLLVCLTCSRTFRRMQDIARHQCQTTRPCISCTNPVNAV